MNWADLLVLAIIAAFVFIGLKKGFIISIFNIASFFISTFLAIKLFPRVAELLTKIGIYSYFETSIYKGLLMQKDTMMSKLGGQVPASSFIDSLPLPGVLKDRVLSNVPNPSQLIDATKTLSIVSGELAKIATNIASLILLFILIRMGLFMARALLKGIANLPVLKQLDKVGGIILGAVEGLLAVYIIFSILIFFNSWPQFEVLFEAVDKSSIAIFFYQNNFILNWMFS
jgi:uncharacterized membrane protein required for colicin V production